MPAPIDRTRILEAALAVWREDGYRDATTRKVAAHAGVGEVTLFRRFGDKAALFQAALELEAERFAGDGITHTGNLEGDLERIVGAYQAMLARSRAIVFDVLLEAPRHPELAAVRLVPLAAIRNVANVIATYQRDGRLRSGDPMQAVLALLGPVLTAALLARAQPGLVTEPDPQGIAQGFLTGWQCVEDRGLR